MDEYASLFDWITDAESVKPERALEHTMLVSGADARQPVAVDSNVRGRFRPLRELGRGGMCSVHDTEDLQLLRNTVLKVMHPEVAAQPNMHRQFIVEARITAQLDHPNIIPIYEFGQDPDGVPFINMRKVSGTTLEACIMEDHAQRLHPDNLKRVARIMVRVCEALAYAHSRAVIHRDLKPSNIMIGGFGEVYVMDWGVAISRPELAVSEPVSITAPGEPPMEETVMAGSPSYVAPEQTTGELAALGPWTDIFLVGAALYHVLVGAPPYGRSGSLLEVLNAAARCDFPTLHERLPDQPLPAGLVRVVEKAMAADPADRYASMEEMRDALLTYLEGSAQVVEAQFAPSTLIVREGDEGDCAYIVRRGYCAVFSLLGGSRHDIGTLGPGDVFGEVAVLSGGLRTSSVEALTTVDVEVVTRAAITGGLTDSATARCVSALAERFVELDRRLRDTTIGGPA